MPRKTTTSKVADAAPVFRDLSAAESEALLARNHVGRLAFSFHDSVDIRPIHYVHDAGWLFGRTSQSDKLIVLRHNQWVAFEVDEISGPFDWSSVIVRGTFYQLRAEGTIHDRNLHARGIDAVRQLAPAALTEQDVVPFRTELFGIAVDTISGRSSSTGGMKKKARRKTRP